MSQLVSTNHHKSHPKIIAAIPCLNEEQFIGDIVTRARAFADMVIVIDDGSTDRTSEAAQTAGAHVIRHKAKQGAGAATRSAFEAAKGYDADVLVTLDGDGQHNPDEIPRVLAPILCGEADLVIGSRFLQPNLNQSQPVSTSLNQAPKYRKFGIDVITWLYNFGSKVKVSDSQSCFRAHSQRLLEAINITENGFGFSVQVLIQARRKGFIIKEVPISCIYHALGSSLNPIVHGLGVAWMVVKLRFRDELLTPKRRNKDGLKE
jgi:glycosyltransferase involved in cell wall biosynthesis